MFYENELKLLCDTFLKSRIPVNFVSLSNPDIISSDQADKFTKLIISNDVLSEQNLKMVKKGRVYKLRTPLGLCYIFFILPASAVDTLIILGPYTHSQITQERILKLCEERGLPPKYRKMIEEYCSTTPIIPESSSLFTLLDCFLERISPSAHFVVEDISAELYQDLTTNTPNDSGELDEIVLNMRKLELRYHFENEMIDAVKRGQPQKLSNLFEGFSKQHFEMRTTDPLRNTKNYCIIMNTLLRKAAESGGVHPIHLDKASSAFAKEIESISKTDDFSSLMENMFNSYCRLVRKHSTLNFSPPVKEAVIIIDSDFTAQLSLKNIAEKIGISEVYLSSIFKKEVGKTITEYIRNKRLNYAEFLLRTSNLQIGTVALHCGIEDVHYFSKLFKAEFGKTPKEYRALKLGF